MADEKIYEWMVTEIRNASENSVVSDFLIDLIYEERKGKFQYKETYFKKIKEYTNKVEVGK